MSKDSEIFEGMEAEKQQGFDRLHTQELRSIGKNFTDSERKDMCVVIPSEYLMEEIKRRERVALEIIKELMETLSAVYGSDLNLAEMEALISKVRAIVKVETDERD